MIHRLRRRHRRMWLMLAFAAPLLYLLALAARQAPPVVPSLPEPLRGAPTGARGAP